MQAPGDCARLGGRRLGGPALPERDPSSMTACALCSAAAARSPSAPSMPRKRPPGLRALRGGQPAPGGHAPPRRGTGPGSQATRPQATRQPSKRVRVAGEGATLGGVQEVVVMVAMVGRRPGGPRWALTPNSLRGPGPWAAAPGGGQRPAGGRTKRCTAQPVPVAARASRHQGARVRACRLDTLPGGRVRANRTRMNGSASQRAAA